MTVAETILNYAGENTKFSLTSLLSATKEQGIADSSTKWYLSKMVKDGRLQRTGYGQYSTCRKPEFHIVPDERLKQIFYNISTAYPGASVCIYNGTHLSQLLHHMSYNALTYIEVNREITEILFHKIQETETSVYLKPSLEVFNNYIDISSPGIIIKPILTGSPTERIDGITVPTLEKLLVDIRKDDDFSYLKGMESKYILENAASLYSINKSRLLRYAGRRNAREEFEKELKDLYL